MTAFVLADAPGLMELVGLFDPDSRSESWPVLTERVENYDLRFPREVVDELQVLARDDQVASWAGGLGGHISEHRADIGFMRPLMSLVASIGSTGGFATLDGKEPAISAVARLAFAYEHSGLDFVVMTGDIGTHPLRPTMEELCASKTWNVVPCADAAALLGLGGFLA